MINNNLMMMQNQIIKKNINENIKSLTFEECFEYYNNNKKFFGWDNSITCRSCLNRSTAYQWNQIYSLPDIFNY